MRHIFSRRVICRGCGIDNIKPVWDLGLQYLYHLERNDAAPLVLGVCDTCQLVQLCHTVDPAHLYGGSYYYRSGINDTMRAALADVVESAKRYVRLSVSVYGDTVVDIGSNDGTLLRNYPRNVNTVGFEPSDAHNAEDITCVARTFFSAENYIKFLEGRFQHPKIITAIAMFYDLDNPIEFLRDVRIVMADDGVFVVQMNYLMAMIDDHTFDNISAEHLCYYSIKDMVRLCSASGLYIEDAERNQVNGGSVRLYIRKVTDKPSGRSDRLARLIDLEDVYYEQGIETHIDAMAHYADTRAFNLRRELEQYKGRVCAVGASTRGYVILQYYGLDDLIDTIIERNPEKVGKTLGNYTLKDEKSLDDYECALILPYFFAEEIKARYANYKGKFILPLT